MDSNLSAPTIGTNTLKQSSGIRTALLLGFSIIACGVCAGLIGIAIEAFLRLVQHVAYGFDLTKSAPIETFLQGVTGASPRRRIAALLSGGLVAGVGWWGLQRFGSPLVTIKQSVGRLGAIGPRMPLFETAIHVLLQISTVGLGSPLGREVAPRELAAMLARRLCDRLGLAPDDARIVVAAAAGAGLAAVYNVPVAGGVFTLEVLLAAVSARAALGAFAACAIAASVARLGLGGTAEYHIHAVHSDLRLMLCAGVIGPIMGLMALQFRGLLNHFSKPRTSGWKRIPETMAAFGLVGLVAGLFPQIVGNGQDPLQLTLDGLVGTKLAIGLFLLKAAAIVLVMRVGAAGGVLTPSLALGALASTVLAATAQTSLGTEGSAAIALIGAAAFLAVSMDMPLTAIVLAIELTDSGFELIDPIVVAVLGATLVKKAAGARVSPSNALRFDPAHH